MSELVRPYKGVSPADRTAERRTRILEACLDVVGETGVAATTVGAVCASAGLTKRYFYESFSSLDAALAQLFDDFQETLLEEIEAHLSDLDADPAARAREMIGALVQALDDPRMARLFTEVDGHPDLHQLRERAYGTYAEAVARDVLGATGAEAQLTALVLVSGITHAVLSWLSGSVAMAREPFIGHLVGLAVAAAATAP